MHISDFILIHNADFYNGKRVILTGASSGIGRNLAVQLSQLGVKYVCPPMKFSFVIQTHLTLLSARLGVCLVKFLQRLRHIRMLCIYSAIMVVAPCHGLFCFVFLQLCSVLCASPCLHCCSVNAIFNAISIAVRHALLFLAFYILRVSSFLLLQISL